MPTGNGSDRHHSWPPSTEEDLRLAASEGTFEERHQVDVKRLIAAGDAANKELAKDLASLAIDGGRLVIGIDEAGGEFTLTPVDLKGLPERVDLVAHSRIDEPLDVEFTTIRTAADPDRGYLIVEVPVSPRAPHMVDHRYWGRTEKGKYPLEDAQVVRLIERRAQWAVDPYRLLDEWIARDPIAQGQGKNGHLHMVCVPVPRRDEMMAPVFAGRDWAMDLTRLVNEARQGDQFSPNIGTATRYFSPTPRGWSCASAERGSGGSVDPHWEEHFIELEIAADGPLYIRSGRATAVYQAAYQARMVLIEIQSLGIAHETLRLCDRLSKEVGFLGSWDFAFAITSLHGAISLLRLQRYLSPENPGYRDDAYRASARASLKEIRARPGIIVNRLLIPLLRAVGIDQAPDLQELLGRPAPAQPGARS